MAIKRLNPIDRPERPLIEWPSETRNNGSCLFQGRAALRKLRVLIDGELQIDPPPSPYSDPDDFDERGLLSGLLTHPFIASYRYSDHGPPAETEGVKTFWEIPAYEGWAVLGETDRGDKVVTYLEGDRQCQAGLIGNVSEVAAADHSTSAYATLGESEAAAKRQSDARAAQVADEALGVDLYITDRPYLHAARWAVARGTTICSPAEALPLVGLYLRSQNEFVIARLHPDCVRLNRGLFFLVGTREL